MSTRLTWLFAFAALTVHASAQEVAASAAQTSSSARENAIVANVFNRTIALQLENVTLKAALHAVAQNAGVSITYSAYVVPTDKRVSLVASHISVRNALATLLGGTGMEAVVLAPGRITLQPIGGGTVNGLGTLLLQQGTATISGSVRDSATGASIPQVTIRVDGTTLETKSGGDGTYKITGATAGEYRVTARRVGYVSHTRTITLTDGQAATLNFLLNPPATKLDEVVTTAIGDQRRYQVGTVISTINVDSIAPTAPVTSVTDIITGRAPGVQIVENSGFIGGGEAIRIWGTSSMLDQSQPILIVDGIREDNQEGGLYSSLFNGVSAGPSRINDIDVSQIETIQILKGPAATTEYGPDAANGVIVIQTKQGTSGKPQWTLSAEQNANTVPMTFSDLYWNWAHSTSGSATPNVLCPLITGTWNGFNNALTSGSCVVDSTTGFNPMDHAATTDEGTGPGSKYNLAVGGGSDVLRYNLSGGLANTVGGTKVPDVFRSEAQALGYPESFLNPNSENQRSARLNAMMQPFRAMSVQLSVAYMSTYQQAPADGITVGSGVPYPDSAYNYGYNNGRSSGEIDTYSPLYDLGRQTTTNLTNWTSGLTARWNPTGWFVGNATLGLENETGVNQNTDLPQADLGQNNFSGELEVEQEAQATYTVNLTGTATATLSRQLRAMSTLGAYMTSTRTSGTDVEGYELSAAEFYLNAASYPTINSLASANASAGVYGEEQLAIADRLFLIGSIGLYSGSNFGGNYAFTAYPKFSVSWLAINHGGTTFRVRGAYGPSGQQPPYGSNEQVFRAFPTVATQSGGTPATGLEFVGYGNLQLQPERVTDLEGGFDLGFWGNRVTIEGTMYDKYTQDALETISLGWDASEGGYVENLGNIDNRGLEGAVTVVPIQSRLVSWTLTLNASFNSNKLIDLAPGVQYIGAGNDQAFVPGYPLFGLFGYHYQYQDLNRDGIIEPNEVTGDTAFTFLGATAPRAMASLATTIGFMHNTFVVSALFNYGGEYVVPYTGSFQASDGVNTLLGTPSWVQGLNARGYRINHGQGDPDNLEVGLDGTYVRFQELSLTYAFPHAWARAMRLTAFSLTGGINNLALWTRYPFGDPQATGYAAGEAYNNNSGITTVDSDLRNGAAKALPLTRHWDIRLNVGF